jgi:hypothetical protein
VPIATRPGFYIIRRNIKVNFSRDIFIKQTDYPVTYNALLAYIEAYIDIYSAIDQRVAKAIDDIIKTFNRKDLFIKNIDRIHNNKESK